MSCKQIEPVLLSRTTKVQLETNFSVMWVVLELLSAVWFNHWKCNYLAVIVLKIIIRAEFKAVLSTRIKTVICNLCETIETIEIKIVLLLLLFGSLIYCLLHTVPLLNEEMSYPLNRLWNVGWAINGNNIIHKTTTTK